MVRTVDVTCEGVFTVDLEVKFLRSEVIYCLKDFLYLVLPDISSSLRLNYVYLQTHLSWASMNHGDVFILDMGRQIYVWNGREAGRLEKIKGLDVARRIKDEERGGRAALEVVG